MEKKNQTLLLGAAIVLAYLLFSGFNLTPSTTLSVGVPSGFGVPSGGGTLLSLSHVLVQGVNQQNMSGYYWFATILLNGGNQQLTSFPFTASQAAASASGSVVNVSGGSQTDTFNIQVLKNQLVYRPQGGVQYGLGTYQLTQPNLPIAYTDCNGNGNPPGKTTGQLATATIGCSLNPTGYVSYVNSCRTVVSSQIPNATGIALQGYNGFSSGLYCLALQKKSWGTLSQFGAAQWVQKVTVGINGASATVNNTSTFAAHINSTNKVDLALTLTPPTAGSTFFGGPPIQSQYALFNNASTSKLITLASFGNLQSTMLAIQNNASVVTNCGTYWAPFGCYNPSTGSGSGPTNVTNYLQSQNNQLVGKIVINPLNSSMNLSGTTLIYNDLTFKYLTPQVQIVSGLALVGLSIATCQPVITSATGTTFYSNGNNVSSVTVRNAGSVAATCTATIVNTTAGLNFGNQQQYLIPAGQTHIFYFTISSSNYIPPGGLGTTNFGTYKICDGVTVQCAFQQVTFFESPACSGSIVNGNTCLPVTTITVPTSTTICTSNCATSTTSTTTIQQCPGGFYFNQTLFNQGSKFPCSPNPSSPLPWYVLVIMGAVVIGAVLYGITGRRRAVKK